MATFADTSGLNYSGLSQEGAPGSPDLILNGAQGREKAIGLLYRDEYNQAAMNAYNNAYNYWLWQKQLEYNSPKAQVERLKEAGLNPNFKWFDGTGNASSIPASQGSTKGNIASNHLQAISAGVNIATGLATSIAKGVQALKTFATTPKSIGFYRKTLTELLGSKFEGSRFDNYLREIELAKRVKMYGVDSDHFGDITHLSDEAPFWQSLGADIDLKMVRKMLGDKQVEAQAFENAYKVWRNNIYNPQLLRNLQQQYYYLVAGTKLRNIEVQWKNPKETLGLLGGIVSLLKTVF